VCLGWMIFFRSFTYSAFICHVRTSIDNLSLARQVDNIRGYVIFADAGVV
jgi:hypothetical protein